MTTGLALFKSLDLPGNPLEPTTEPIPVLVYGGSSATGTAAVQLVKLAGFEPIATCSPRNFELVKSYGASAVFDYQDPNCTADIRKHTKNKIKYALDCISTTSSMQFCYQAMVALAVVKPDWIMGPQMLGKEIRWPEPHWRPANAEMGEFGVTGRLFYGSCLIMG
ncbi:hypothetical protein ACKAV7_004005 [Fusarium commune]